MAEGQKREGGGRPEPRQAPGGLAADTEKSIRAVLGPEALIVITLLLNILPMVVGFGQNVLELDNFNYIMVYIAVLLVLGVYFLDVSRRVTLKQQTIKYALCLLIAVPLVSINAWNAWMAQEYTQARRTSESKARDVERSGTLSVQPPVVSAGRSDGMTGAPAFKIEER